MALTMKINITPRSGRYYAEIWDGNIRLGKTRQWTCSAYAKKSGQELLDKWKQKQTGKQPKKVTFTYRRPLDYDNKCYRIDPVTGERTPL